MKSSEKEKLIGYIKVMIDYNNACKNRTQCIYSKDRYTGICNALSEVLRYIERGGRNDKIHK